MTGVRPAAVLFVAATLLAAACGDSREANQGEETVPRITPAPTVVAPTEPPTVATDPPPTVPATVAPTAPPTPWPTSLRTDPPTNPPTAVPTNPPAIQETNPPSPTNASPAPTQPATPTSTLVVSPATPPTCSAEGIGNDTGHLTIANVSCNAGWAIGLIDDCPVGVECEGVDVFHVTSAGWVHDGYYPAVCAEGLTGAGMSVYTAATFVPSYCEEAPGATAVIRPDTSGERVVQLQTALVAEGYQLSSDGTYGPRTQAAVRDFQARRGLEVDGIAGPQTQATLGIGPGGSDATSPTSTPATATTSPTAAPGPSESTSTTVVLTPGEPAECTAEAIGGDISTTILEITACQSGWALGRIYSCAAQTVCEDADVFHVTENGWVYDGNVSALCAEDLRGAGMSTYTAAEFGTFCVEDDPPAQAEIVRPDSTGDDVRNLQVALVALGYPISADGTYGPRTQAAVRDYQAANGLTVDGIAGPQTRLSLGV